MNTRNALIIENGKGMSQIFGRLSSSWKIETCRVNTLSDAISHLEHCQHDAIVFDCNLCNQFKSDFLQTITKFPAKTNLIVALDSSFNVDVVRVLRLLGVQVLTKPLQGDALFQALMGGLKRRAADRERDDLSSEIVHTLETLQEQSATIKRLTKLVADLVTQSPTSSGHTGGREPGLDATAAQPDLYKAISLLASLVDEVRKDKALAKYQFQLAMLVDCLENLECGATPKNSCLRELSMRELRVVSMIKCGMTTDKIAEQLHISPDTVKTHRRNIRKKLDIVGAKNDLASFLRFDMTDGSADRAIPQRANGAG
jgi:DNA-binding NarL/FixJ family response regulator